MLREDWNSVQRLLVIHAGVPSRVEVLSPALQQLVQTIPHAEIRLLCSPAAKQMAVLLPNGIEFFVHEALSGQALSNPSSQLLDLVDVLRSQKFDAAIVFSDAQVSPHALAYLCYLAEIPVRIGQSQEFGGGVLTEWVKPKDKQSGHFVELLNAVGLEAT